MLENGLLNEIKNLKNQTRQSKAQRGTNKNFPGIKFTVLDLNINIPPCFCKIKSAKDEMIDNMIKKTGAMLSAR